MLLRKNPWVHLDVAAVWTGFGNLGLRSHTKSLVDEPVGGEMDEMICLGLISNCLALLGSYLSMIEKNYLVAAREACGK